jgi:YD repeat-containing protein
VTDAQSHSSTYVYDPFSNLKQVTDAASNVTTYSYDARGRKITSNGPNRHHQPLGYCFLGCFWKPIFTGIQSLFENVPVLGTKPIGVAVAPDIARPKAMAR